MNAGTFSFNRGSVSVALLCLELVAAGLIGCQRAQAPSSDGVSIQEAKALSERNADEANIPPVPAESDVDDKARFERLIETSPRLSIEIVEPGKFKIDDRGPFTAEEARAEAVRVATGKKLILVNLVSSRAAIADEEYQVFKESLHNDGGLLVGLDIAGLGETRQP